MSGIFGHKQSAATAPVPVPTPIPVVSSSDTINRINNALGRRLQSGGSNADATGAAPAPTGAAHMPTLTGLN